MEIEQEKPDMDKLPGGWKPDIELQLDEVPDDHQIHFPLDNVVIVDNLLTDADCTQLKELMDKAPSLESVGINGFMDNGQESNIGSKRATLWTMQISGEIWKKLDSLNVLDTRTMDSFSPTDWWQGDRSRRVWKPLLASPMMRFMRYEKSGQHYAHYDAGYIYKNDNYRTLMSYVIYLTDCEEGGSTRFIKDDQQDFRVWERDHFDWTREATENEVIHAVKPLKGSILLFDHRMCHDVEQYMGDNPRIIIRGDIIFEAQTND